MEKLYSKEITKQAMPEKSSPKIFIVVLNWNGEADTKDCLISLRKISYSNYEIILIDNGSTDGSDNRLKSAFPEVAFYKNIENFGFAKGNNIGIRYALEKGADYIVLLNNDTVVDPDFLTFLIQKAESNPQIGIIGPKIYFFNSDIIWYGGGMLNARTGFTYHIGEGEPDNGQCDEEREVDFISGCVMLVKKKVFDNVGLLDKDYFHSHEDADYCLRAKKKGFKIAYVPKSVVYHKLARTCGGRRSAFYLYYRTRNHLLFKKKQAIKALLFWPIFVFLIIKRILGSLLIGQPKGALATIIGIFDFYIGKWGKGSGEKFR
jgi:GT2 family glycosyltransferase